MNLGLLPWKKSGSVKRTMNQLNGKLMIYQDIITIDPDKRGGRPCIRGLRITVYDVLGWLANGMTPAEIIEDFPELTHTDIMACLATKLGK